MATYLWWQCWASQESRILDAFLFPFREKLLVVSSLSAILSKSVSPPGLLGDSCKTCLCPRQLSLYKIHENVQNAPQIIAPTLVFLSQRMHGGVLATPSELCVDALDGAQTRVRIHTSSCRLM